MSLLVQHWWGWVRHISRPTITGLRAGRGGEIPYLDRYTVRRQRDSGANPWRLYLHHFLARDSEDFHNHPSLWSLSIVLWGSYTEEVLEPRTDPTQSCVQEGCCMRSRVVRWFNWIPATKYHRITVLHPGPGAWGVWTLFLCGPLTGRGWGFFRPGIGHVDHSVAKHTKVTTIEDN